MHAFHSRRGTGRKRPSGHRAAVVRLVAWWAVLGSCTVPPSGERTEVFIPPGASLEAVAESLAAHGVIRSARAFRIYAGMSSGADSIEGGVYYLHSAPLGELLPVLLRGPTLGKLSVPEGAMAVEVAGVVELGLGMPQDHFLAALRSEALRARVGARGPTLEGYLYPTTYYVALDITADELVGRMVDEFVNHRRPEWTRLASSVGLAPDEVVTLASIVSGETRDAEDQPLVASVYRNRLENGMRLQADPTVVYALGERRRLTNRDYRIDSPYNTYLIDGLPPHPVSQPSAASIEAVLDPPPTDYLYMVAGADGKHVFSATYREHLTAIRRIRSGAAALEESEQ
jgi:UPF0755 protein